MKFQTLTSILVLSITITFFGCSKKFVQVFNTNSLLLQNNEGNYIYENDSLKITYNFWKEKGLMSFTIHNKQKLPLYIDWKKSSYIDNSVKLNYWVDAEKKSAISSYGNYYYSGPELKDGYAVSVGLSQSSSSSFKPERITFIPPNSNYTRTQFYILPVLFYPVNKDLEYEIVPRSDNTKKKTKVYTANFPVENSPIKFRNFLTYSFTEDFKEEYYIDNAFAVTEILEMDERHFQHYKFDDSKKGKWLIKDQNGNPILFSDFKTYRSFYIHIPLEGSYKIRR